MEFRTLFLHPAPTHGSPVPDRSYPTPRISPSHPDRHPDCTFPPTGNSHFLQMGEFFKHPGGLQDGNLIVV